MINAREYHNTSPDYQAAVIKDAAEQCGSLKTLAEKAGITYDYLGKLKNGQRNWTYALQRLIEDISKGSASMETPKTIKVANNFCAIPTRCGGCIIPREKLPPEFINNKDYAEFVLPVSLSAVKWDLYLKQNPYARPPFSFHEDNYWIVVKYKNAGLVMTVKEAEERGLQEEPNWYPDLVKWANETIDAQER